MNIKFRDIRAASRYGFRSGFAKILRLLAAPAPQHCMFHGIPELGPELQEAASFLVSEPHQSDVAPHH
jgi:hypothetical protein